MEKLKQISQCGEAWKPIPNTNERYYISSFGRVYSKRNNILRKLNSCTHGYLQFDYNDNDGKRITMKVHRLVAILFVEGRQPNLIVNHIDGNKQNNYHTNLEWVTPKYNTQHMLDNNLKKHFPNNLPNKAKPVLCVETGQVFKSTIEASKKMGIHQPNISKVCNGVQPTTKGYTFRFIEEEK